MAGGAHQNQEEEAGMEAERLPDWISTLPDGLLGDIVSLLPTKDGARTQILSSHWRHLWRAAPLNLDLHDGSHISVILSAHPGPCRRFVLPRHYVEYPSRTTLDGWLGSSQFDNLQELDFSYGLLPLPPSVHHRFLSTLCVARFMACRFQDGNNASMLRLPLLKQLTLFAVDISESSLKALLAGCPVLESLLLLHNLGFHQLKIMSSSLRSIGVDSGGLCHIEDAPCLERLLYFGRIEMNILVTSAPRLAILGKPFDGFPRLQFGATVFQGATNVSMSVVVSSVKVLALYGANLCLDALINLFKCFPHLQKLYIEIKRVWGKDWCTYQKLDIGLRKIVLRNYRGNKSHINLASFFVSNARLLESMRFEIESQNVNTKWIGRQHRLLQIKKSATRGAQFDFVSPSKFTGSRHEHCVEQVHDLSADPFCKFN